MMAMSRVLSSLDPASMVPPPPSLGTASMEPLGTVPTVPLDMEPMVPPPSLDKARLVVPSSLDRSKKMMGAVRSIGGAGAVELHAFRWAVYRARLVDKDAFEHDSVDSRRSSTRAFLEAGSAQGQPIRRGKVGIDAAV